MALQYTWIIICPTEFISSKTFPALGVTRANSVVIMDL